MPPRFFGKGRPENFLTKQKKCVILSQRPPFEEKTMKKARLIALCASIASFFVVRLTVYAEDLFSVGNEIRADRADFLLYALIAVTGLVLLGLAIYVFWRRRK